MLQVINVRHHHRAYKKMISPLVGREMDSVVMVLVVSPFEGLAVAACERFMVFQSFVPIVKI